MKVVWETCLQGHFVAFSRSFISCNSKVLKRSVSLRFDELLGHFGHFIHAFAESVARNCIRSWKTFSQECIIFTYLEHAICDRVSCVVQVFLQFCWFSWLAASLAYWQRLRSAPRVEYFHHLARSSALHDFPEFVLGRSNQ